MKINMKNLSKVEAIQITFLAEISNNIDYVKNIVTAGLIFTAANFAILLFFLMFL